MSGVLLTITTNSLISLPASRPPRLYIHSPPLSVRRECIADPNLRIKITTLGIENIHVIDNTVDILQLCQFHIRFGRTLQFKAQLIYLLYLVEVHNRILGFFESIQYCLFITMHFGFKRSFLRFQSSPVLAPVEKRSQYRTILQRIRRLKKVGQDITLQSKLTG